MRLLATGLAFFATALALAVLPVVARGGPVNPNVPCTITGTNNGELLYGDWGSDRLWARDSQHDHLNCGAGARDFARADLGRDVRRYCESVRP